MPDIQVRHCRHLPVQCSKVFDTRGHRGCLRQTRHTPAPEPKSQMVMNSPTVPRWKAELGATQSSLLDSSVVERHHVLGEKGRNKKFRHARFELPVFGVQIFLPKVFHSQHILHFFLPQLQHTKSVPAQHQEQPMRWRNTKLSSLSTSCNATDRFLREPTSNRVCETKLYKLHQAV